MKKTPFTEAQIVSTLKMANDSLKVADICRKHGISDATYYNWMPNVPGSHEGVGGEQPQYKRMYAGLTRENDAMKSLIA